VETTILAIGHRFPNLDIERDVLTSASGPKSSGPVLVVDGNLPEMADSHNLQRALGAAHAILLGTQYRLDAPTIAQLHSCRIIVRYGIGTDNVDIEAASDAGIAVANVPDYCLDEVSDHTLALLLHAARRLTPAQNATRQGAWGVAAMAGTRRLSRQTLGLIGYGRIGRLVASKARAFGLRVLVHDPYTPPERLAAEGVSASELAPLVRESDYISLHCPLTPDTEGLVGAAFLAMMQPHAVLINTSRGGLVDLPALLAALDAGTLAHAMLDVLPSEPVAADHPAAQHPKILLTPHVAWFSSDAVADLRRRTAEIAAQALAGERPASQLNTPTTASAGRRGG
jgi:D-3-phosphoglycerate dehydrogenase / 2-oxoglutarate reductase